MGTTPTIDLPRTKVRVVKPNPETGEIIERVIPAKDFRPKPPRFPKLDDRLITLVQRADSEGPTGRSVIAMFAHREAVIAYWAYYAHILTRIERRQLAQGTASSLLRELPPAWKVGDRMFVAANMEAEVTELTESARGYGTVFKIHDYRVLYLRRGVLGDAKPKTDEDGFAAPLTPEEKERARLNGAYTGSASQAVDESGGIMDEQAYQRILGDKDAADKLAQNKGRVQVTKGRLERRLAEAKAKNRRGMVRYLERQLKALASKSRAAA